MPRRVLAQRRAQDPAAQWPNEAGPLGEWDEHIWSHQSALRVSPSDQRFDGDQGTGPNIHLRLVVQHELTTLDGAAQISQQPESLGAVEVGLWLIQRQAAVGLLGRVHRNV